MCQPAVLPPINNQRSTLNSRLGALLLWLPALTLLGAVLWFRVDVPWADVWDTPGRLVEKMLNGQAGWSDWFWQHNESRKFFPRLFYVATGLIAGLHTLPGVLLQWALLAGTFALLISWAPIRDAAHRWLLSAIALLVFTPAQSENLTWDIQFIVIVPVFCIVLAAKVNASARSVAFKYGCSATLALIATYTFANGMVCWLLCFPAWWRLAPGSTDRRWFGRWDAVYLLIGGLALAGYFSDYVKPPQHPSLGLATQQPGQAVLFFLAWIGGPWSQALTQPLPSAILLGALLLGASAVLVGQALRRWSTLPTAALGWLLLLAYGLISGAVATLGRLGFGLAFALPPRYVPFALWIPVAVLGLAHCLHRDRPAPLAAATAALGLLALLSWPAGMVGLAERQRAYEQGRLTLRFIDAIPADPLLTRVHPERENLQRRARLFAQRGWLELDFVNPRGGLAGALAAPRSSEGGWYLIRVDGNRVHVDGWTMLPAPTREAPCVLVGLRRDDGSIEPVTALAVRLRRPEIGVAMKAPALVRCGFDDTFDFPNPPPAERWVLCAFDEKTGEAHQLQRPK